jgi:hypothetical protein
VTTSHPHPYETQTIHHGEACPRMPSLIKKEAR